MRCKHCGREHNGTYGSRCEDCWADDQSTQVRSFAVHRAENLKFFRGEETLKSPEFKRHVKDMATAVRF